MVAELEPGPLQLGDRVALETDASLCGVCRHSRAEEDNRYP